MASTLGVRVRNFINGAHYIQQEHATPSDLQEAPVHVSFTF
jgi:hypothetical protein